MSNKRPYRKKPTQADVAKLAGVSQTTVSLVLNSRPDASLPAETIVVGGHDPPADLDAVHRQIAETRQCMAFVRRALADDLDRDATVKRAEGRFPAPWVRFFYGALTHPGG